jgi:hypothetical protein
LAIVYYLADFITNLLKIKPIKKQNIIASILFSPNQKGGGILRWWRSLVEWLETTCLFGVAGETGDFYTKAL